MAAKEHGITRSLPETRRLADTGPCDVLPVIANANWTG